MTNEEYSNLRDDIKCLILDLVGDPDIRRAIGELIFDAPVDAEEYVGPAAHADTSSIPEYRPIRPEAEK